MSSAWVLKISVWTDRFAERRAGANSSTSRFTRLRESEHEMLVSEEAGDLKTGVRYKNGLLVNKQTLSVSVKG